MNKIIYCLFFCSFSYAMDIQLNVFADHTGTQDVLIYDDIQTQVKDVSDTQIITDVQSYFGVVKLSDRLLKRRTAAITKIQELLVRIKRGTMSLSEFKIVRNEAVSLWPSADLFQVNDTFIFLDTYVTRATE